MPDPEYTLVDAIAHGDPEAFEAFVKRYQGPLLNFIGRFLGDRGAAEDLTQEVFLRVYEAAHRFQERGRVSSWVFKIAYNLSVNELKRRERLRRYLGEAPPAETVFAVPMQADSASDYELQEAVASALGELSDNQRAALLLRVREGLSYREIAEALDLSVQSVDSLIFRARRHMKEALGHETKDESMQCRDVSARISAFIDHELDPALARKTAGHIRECAECRREFEALSGLDALIGDLPRYDPRPGFAERLVSRVSGPPAREESRGFWAWLFTALFRLLGPSSTPGTRTLEEFDDVPASFIGHAYFRIL